VPARKKSVKKLILAVPEREIVVPPRDEFVLSRDDSVTERSLGVL
jgi:hypothetical protein